MSISHYLLRLRKSDTKSISWISIFILVIFIGIALVVALGPGWKILPKKIFFFPQRTKLERLCQQYHGADKINWNTLYYYENRKAGKKLVWCKVPKAGSTTLTKTFLRLAGLRRYNSTTKIHRLLRHFYPRLKDASMARKMRSSFKFVVVRDPFERILSAYRDKLESYQRDLQFRDGYYYENYGKKMVTTPVINGTVQEPSWSEFVTYLTKTSVKTFDEHWMPMTRLCSPCSIKFDAIVKMEKFDEEIKLPLSKAGIDFQLGWAHKTGTADKDIIKSYYQNLTYTQVNRLYQVYKKDFALFGYSPLKYFRLVDGNFDLDQQSGMTVTPYARTTSRNPTL